MRYKSGRGKVKNEPLIEGKYYWINDYNNKDNVIYNFYYVNNVTAFRIRFDDKIEYLAHISVICALGRENFGIDVLGGYYIFNNKKIRDVKKIARICSNKLQDNYDCVIEPCPDGLFNECVLLANKSAIKYTPINIISRRNTMIKSSVSKTQEVFDNAIRKAAELVKFINEESEYIDTNDESNPDTQKLNELNEEISQYEIQLHDLPDDFETGRLYDYMENLLGKDYFSDKRCWSYLYDIVDDIASNIDWNGYLKSNRRIDMKKNIKSGRFIKSGAGAGYDVTIKGIELDTQNYTVISDEVVDEKYNEHNTIVELPVKPCSVEWEAEDYYNRVSSEDGIELDGIPVMEYFDDDKQVNGGKATLKLVWYQTDSNEFNHQSEFTDVETACDYCIPDSISIKSSFSAGWIHSDLPTEQIHFEDEYYGYSLDIGEVYYYETMSVDLVAPNISKNINWFFAHDDELEKIFFDDEEDYEDEELTNSRKSIKSGMSYQDALVGFTSMGKPWGDYWEMQQDWAAYVDSLERDGEVDYEEAKNWDNPCTPQTFKDWINE